MSENESNIIEDDFDYGLITCQSVASEIPISKPTRQLYVSKRKEDTSSLKFISSICVPEHLKTTLVFPTIDKTFCLTCAHVRTCG